MIDSTRRQQQRLRIGGATALKRFFHLSGRCRAGGAWLPPYRRNRLSAMRPAGRTAPSVA
jgi:hypothetical protein